MNRREFVKGMGAVAGAAALGNIGFAEEGKKKVKSIVIYFSHTGENYSVGVITVGNTAKVAKEIAAQTGAATWEIKEKNAYPEKYTPCIEVAKKELQAKARPEFVGDAPVICCFYFHTTTSKYGKIYASFLGVVCPAQGGMRK